KIDHFRAARVRTAHNQYPAGGIIHHGGAIGAITEVADGTRAQFPRTRYAQESSSSGWTGDEDLAIRALECPGVEVVVSTARRRQIPPCAVLEDLRYRIYNRVAIGVGVSTACH